MSEVTNKGVGPYDTTGLIFRPCRACKTPIAFVKSDKRKTLPVTADGISHYLTCTDQKRFSRSKP